MRREKCLQMWIFELELIIVSRQMISKNNIKLIKSLKVKKYRLREKRFIVEGAKNVLELTDSDFDIELILCTDEFIETYGKLLSDYHTVIVDVQLLSDVGTFGTNTTCLAMVRMKDEVAEEIDLKRKIFALDGVGDPGNLGTIIRTLDWFGFDQIACSHDTAELYNPKVINSSMGSFTRVNILYVDLDEYLHKCDLPVYGAQMDGMNLYEAKIEDPSVIVMGSESHGISDRVKARLDHSISIPKMGNAESLNVAIATGVIASYLRFS